MLRVLAFVCVAVAFAAGRPSESLCRVCRDAVHDIHKAATDQDLHARILGRLEEVCARAEEGREECNDVITGLTQEVLQVLLADMTPLDLCRAMTVCPTGVPERPQPVQKMVGNPVENMTCELCEFIVQTVDKLLVNNSTPAQANKTVMAVCNALPEPTKTLCITFAPLLVDMITEGVSPVGACTNLGICLLDKKPTWSPRPKKPAVQAKVGDSPVCELCELLVQAVDQYLKNNKSEAAINATVYKLCNDLPASLKDMCLAFAPQLVAALANGVDPKEACTKLKLCTSDYEKPTVLHDKASPACELCELLVQAVDQYLKNNKSEAAINATVYKLCNDLPASLKDMCLAFAPQLVAALANGVDPKEACTKLKLCTSVSQGQPRPLSAKDTPACELCQLLVQAVDQYLKDNKTEAAINATVYKLCNDLPAGLKDTCLAFAPQLVAALANGVDPKEACTKLKLCTGLENQTPVSNSVSNGISVRMPEMMDAKVQVGDSPACELCELLVQAVDQYLKDNKSEAAINATVYKLCNDLPASLKDMCLAFAPQLVAVLAKGFDPKQACTAIKLCTNTTAVSENTSLMKPQGQQVEDTPACELCELLVQAVDQYLKNNKSEAAINATVYKLCNDLPASLKDMCLAFAPQLVAVLAKGFDPKQACTAIKLCTNTTTVSENVSFLKPQGQQVEDTPACELCQLLVQAVDQYLKDNKTEAAINATVYKLCNDLPAGIKDTCLAFAPQLVAALANGVDPKQACTAIKLCSSDGYVPGRLSTVLLSYHDLPVVKDIRCTVCKNAFQILDQDLYRDEGKLQKFLDDICHRLPPPTDSACLNAADTNFPEIWEKLLTGTLSPDHVCKLLTLCS